MMRSYVTQCPWNSPVPLARNARFYLSRCVAAKPTGPKPGWLHNLETDAEMCVHCTRHRSWHQQLEAAPHRHMGKHITKRHRQSSWSMEKAITCKQAWGKRTSLWTSAELKPALFRANTLHNRLFSETPQSTEENTLFRVISVAAI